MSSRRRAVLPPELINFITGYLDGDLVSLKACSLLGSIWAASARPRKFRSLKVYILRYGRRVTLLLEYLKSTPSVAGCIQELCLQGAYNSSLNRDIDAGTVSMLLKTIPQLRVLSLQDMVYGENLKGLVSAPRFRLTTLQMRCHSVSAEGLRTFMEILSLFTELDEFHLQQVPYLVDREALLLHEQPPIDDVDLHIPKMRAVLLGLREYDMFPLLHDYLRISPEAGILKNLSVTVCGSLDLEGLSHTLSEYGPHLEELEIHVMMGLFEVSEDQWRSRLHLADLSGVHTLR